MDTQQIKDFIMQELPGILREDAEGQDRKWWEQNRKWEENQEEIRELMRSVGRLDSTAGALGARWGLHA